MTKKNTLSRRGFLASAAAVAAPMIIPSGVLAAPGRPGANDRIVTGHIGVGGMGRHHLGRMHANVGAVCDADDNHLKKAVEMLQRDVPTCKDYRRILERKDIDAVFIAAPDHWHGVMAVHACEAGKDVYCEKPSSKTVEEGQAMLRAVERYGRVMQIGSQGRSHPHSHAMCNYVRNGMLGKVTRVECWHTESPVGGDLTKFGPAPANLDWDLWLGPVKWRPYNPDYVHFNFRWMLDWGGGNIRDRGAHVFSVVSWFLDLDNTGPVRVTAKGTPPPYGLYDCPPQFEVTYEFKEPELTIVWAQPGKPAADAAFGEVYYGTKDKAVFKGGDGGCGAEEKVLNYTPPADGISMFKSPGHHENFLNCVKTRENPLMNIAAAHKVAVMCILGNISYRVGRSLEWDPVNETIIGDEQASRMLSNPGRGPWHV